MSETTVMAREASAPLSFPSVLGAGDGPAAAGDGEAAAYFGDLNLDQVVDAVTRGREDYDLESFFSTRLVTPDAVAYRHEVFRDLENGAVRSSIAAFGEEMRRMRGQLARGERGRYRYEKEAWFLDAVETYGAAVRGLARDLEDTDVGSRGLRAVREYVGDYVGSERFATLLSETRQVREALAGVRYTLTIRGNRVRVGRYAFEPDYSAEVEQTFARFRQGRVEGHSITLPSSPEMNQVEATVLDLVARLHPEAFSALDGYRERHADYLDDGVAAFDREVQFYLAYLEHVERLTGAGLAFCLPHVSRESKELRARDAFDIALAAKLVAKRSPVVTNDLQLDDPERILVVSGPNQGGKTTFARMFGQLHHLAAVGCPVPGRKARLFLCDRLFTQFEKEENLSNLSGKLEDDLVRMHDILTGATPDSIVIMNETFTSTTLSDALVLGRAVLEQMVELDLLCVYVTFVDRLASLGETTVSMVSTVLPDDPASRTYKVMRRPADGLAYAAAIAEKYGLAPDSLRERLRS